MENVNKLIGKAGNANTPIEAMQYSQAALNAANALCALAAYQKGNC